MDDDTLFAPRSQANTLSLRNLGTHLGHRHAHAWRSAHWESTTLPLGEAASNWRPGDAVRTPGEPGQPVLTTGRGTSVLRQEPGGACGLHVLLAGEARWTIAHRELTLRPWAYLVAASGEPFTLRVESASVTELLTVSVPVSMLAATRSAEGSLCASHRGDTPGIAAEPATGIYPPGDAVWGHLRHLCTEALWGVGNGAVERATACLGAALVEAGRRHRARAERIRATRASTRLDILRRVCAGRDHIESHLCERLRLSAIAKAAAMSPFHFHRSFASVFGVTPHAYATARRMALAAVLLARGTTRIRDVAYATGFANETSFGAAFRHHMRCTPCAYRRACRPPCTHPSATTALAPPAPPPAFA